MNLSNALYEPPGPRARRRILIGSAGTILIGLLLLVAVIRTLSIHGQFSRSLWSPIVDPADPQFGPLWRFLGRGLVNSLKVVVFATAFSLVAGVAVAVAALLSNKWIARLIQALVELVRAVPVVILIFFVSIVMPQNHIRLGVLWYVVIAVTMHNAAVIAVIVGAGVAALPRGQQDAAHALGMSRRTTMRLVLLPQAGRLMLPALISQLVMVVKDSTLSFIVSFTDFLHSAQIAVETLQNPLQLYFVVAVVFVLVNLSLSLLADRIGRIRKHAPAITTTGPEGALIETADAGLDLTSMSVDQSARLESKH